MVVREDASERVAAEVRDAEGVEERLRAAAVDVVVRTLAGPDAARGRERHRDRALFHSLIEQGQREGVFADQVSGDLVADFYLGSVCSLAAWYRPEGGHAPASVGHCYARLLLEGLRPGPAESRRPAPGVLR